MADGHPAYSLFAFMSAIGPSVTNDYTLHIWNANTGCPDGSGFSGHTAGVTRVSFLFNDDRLVSGSEDKTLRIWDSEEGKPIGIPFVGVRHSEVIFCAAFSPDGDRIVSGSADRTV